MHPVHPSKPRNKSVPLANDAMLQILFQIDAKPCALVNLACNPCNFANRYIAEHKHKTWLTSQAKYSTSQTPPRVGFDPSNRNPLRPLAPGTGNKPHSQVHAPVSFARETKRSVFHWPSIQILKTHRGLHIGPLSSIFDLLTSARSTASRYTSKISPITRSG